MNLNRITILVGSFAIVIIVALGWFVGISPKIAEADATAAQQQVVETQNTAQEAELVTLRAQFAQLDVLRADYGALQSSIPGDANGDDFVDQLQAAATATGVILTTASLGEPQAYIPFGETAAPVADPAVEAPAAGSPAAGSSTLIGKLYTVSVAVGVSGSTEQIYNFVGAMQSGSRMLIVNGSSFDASESLSIGALTGYILVVVDSPTPTTEPAG